MLKKLLTFAAAAAISMCVNAQDTYELGLDNLGSGWGSSYDPETKTITYEGAWTGRGWWLGEFDASAYTDVVVECEPTTIPVQMVIEYGEGEAVNTGKLAVGTSTITWELDPERKASLKQIYLQCIEPGTLTLNAAYLIDNSGAPYNPVIWRGEEALTSWGNFIEIKPTKFKAGDRIGFVFETENGGSFKANCVNSSWQWCPMTSYSDNPGYSEEWNTVWLGENGAVAAYIDETDAENYAYGLQIGGDGLTLIKVVYFPAGTTTSVYVTGDGEGLGAWDLANTLAVEGEFGVHSFSSANLSEFKFSTLATTDWSEFNTRAFSAGKSVIGENKLSVYPQDRNNNTPWAGDYDVTIDLCAMTLTLATETPAPEVEKHDIYLRGDMNGWGTGPEYLFSSEDGVIYTLAGVSIEAGTAFKFATSDWSTVDLGGVSDMKVNTTYNLTPWGFNCTLAESVSDATIILDLRYQTVVFSTTTSIADMGVEASEAVYYNLQGMQTASPSRGAYIKRVGDKVSKVIVK